MSQKQLQRVKVIEYAAVGRLSVREAARLLQLRERQVQRLKRRHCPDSADWVRHGNRGRPMPWAVSLPLSAAALIMKFGIEVSCDRFKPDFIMEARLHADRFLQRAHVRQELRIVLRLPQLVDEQLHRFHG